MMPLDPHAMSGIRRNAGTPLKRISSSSCSRTSSASTVFAVSMKSAATIPTPSRQAEMVNGTL